MNSNSRYSPETLNLGQNLRFFNLCDQEIWRMTMKKIGLLFYVTASSVHYFIAICVFKLELQSRNAKFESKLSIFLILTCDVLLSYTACKLTHDFSDFLSS